MTRHSPSLLIVLALAAAAALTGCSPTPAPTPSPTPAFATEDEAFAAAEQTYRAYNDAGNAGGDALALLIGPALDDELETTRDLEERGLRLDGTSVVDYFSGVSADLDSSSRIVVAAVCVDVSQVRVLDAAGADKTPPDRPSRWNLEVVFTSTDDGLLISGSSPASVQPC